jgi:tetratricopeptide (TPR) repeat protein
LPLARASHDGKAEAWALDTIGQVYERFDDKRKAVEYYEQALPLMRTTNDRDGEANTLNFLAAAYLRLGEKRKALDYLEQAIKIFGKYRTCTGCPPLPITWEPPTMTWVTISTR